MYKRIVRTLRNKRFWCWLTGICFFLGHDVKGAPLIKGYQAVRGEWLGGWYSYCSRCSSVDPGVYPHNWWRRSLFHRTIGVSWNATRNLYYFRYVWPVKRYFLYRADGEREERGLVRRIVSLVSLRSGGDVSLCFGKYITQEDVDKVTKEVLKHDFKKRK
ncbi:MAG: hypothetical protein WA003_03690 [Desulfuromonadaceae bacterium]